VALRQRAAEDGEVLREHVDELSRDAPVPGDDAIAVRALVLEPEVAAAMHHEAVELDERAVIEEHVEPLARAELALVVLRLETLGAAAELGLSAPFLEELELLFHGHGVRSYSLAAPGASEKGSTQ